VKEFETFTKLFEAPKIRTHNFAVVDGDLSLFGTGAASARDAILGMARFKSHLNESCLCVGSKSED
jgi:hypothetical protein